MGGLDAIEFLEYVYGRFNARDMEAVLSAMHEDVVWANGMEGGYLHGREEVRRYWIRQWAMLDPRVEPTGFSDAGDGKVDVEVHQVVRNLSGAVLADTTVGHIFQIEDGRIRRFEIRRT